MLCRWYVDIQKKWYQISDTDVKGFKDVLYGIWFYNQWSKIKHFSAKMDQQELNKLSEATRYKQGKLPFKYLGVPISQKKLSTIDC